MNETIRTPIGKLNVEIDGDGPPVLWIHAFPLAGALWRPQVEAIPGFRHIVPDLPGFGRSPEATSPYTLDDVAASLGALLDALAVKSCAVAGVSMGGYVLFGLFRQRPAAIAAALFCDTRAGADSDEGKANREKFALAVTKDGAAYAAREMLPKLVAENAAPSVKNELERLILANPPGGIAAAQRAMATRPDSRPLLAAIRVPALVVTGAEDKLIPPAEAEAIAAAIPSAKLVSIAGAAHLPGIERPGEFNAAAKSFLERHAPASTGSGGVT
jgi:pimeloyl-ACP methyl ester carboxylesterase